MKELLTVNANYHAVWTDGDKNELPDEISYGK